MKYNIDQLKDKINNVVAFWGHRESNINVITSKCLSQWYNNESSFLVDGIRYPTAEHYMMYQKALLFKDNVIAFKILGTNSPQEAKRLGRLVKNYNEKIWNENRFEIVKKGNIHKFVQNKKLGNFLVNTKLSILIEASPYDKIWGVGMDSENADILHPRKWNGLNLLGFVLMEVRDELIQH